MSSCQHLKFQMLQLPHFSLLFLPDCNAWPCVCTTWAKYQHVLCLCTSPLQSEMSPVHFQSWSAHSSKPDVSLQNSSHLGYRIVLQHVKCGLLSRISRHWVVQLEVQTWLKRHKENSRQTEKAITKAMKQPLFHVVAWEGKFATYYLMQSWQLRTQLMQRHQLKLFFFLPL